MRSLEANPFTINNIKAAAYFTRLYSKQMRSDRRKLKANTVNVFFGGINSEALMLSSKQYCGILNGSARNSSSYKLDHVLSAMGLDEKRIKSAVKISWGTNSDILDSFQRLLNTVKGLKK